MATAWSWHGLRAAIAAHPILASALALGGLGLVAAAAYMITHPAPQDCGPDFNCFYSAMLDNCKPAQMIVEENHVRASFTTLGAHAGNESACDMRVRLEGYDRPDGMDNSTWAAVEAVRPVAVGLDMTCYADAGTAQALHSQKQLITARAVFDTCQGPLRDVLSRFVASAQNARSTY